MLQIVIPSIELYDNVKSEFIPTKEYSLRLEHSLVSLAKWESKWCKPFLSKTIKSSEESIDYIRCMTVSTNVDPECYDYIRNDFIDKVTEYIESPMTATTFSDNEKKINREIVTAEIIYYWMFSFAIPLECEKWHLNRLLTLINVFNIKQQPSKKMSKKELFDKQRALNAARRKRVNSNG